jgi:hypothetical protein
MLNSFVSYGFHEYVQNDKVQGTSGKLIVQGKENFEPCLHQLCTAGWVFPLSWLKMQDFEDCGLMYKFRADNQSLNKNDKNSISICGRSLLHQWL